MELSKVQCEGRRIINETFGFLLRQLLQIFVENLLNVRCPGLRAAKAVPFGVVCSLVGR